MIVFSYINPILYIIIASFCSAIAIGVGIGLLKASKRYNNSLFTYFGLYTIGMTLSTVFIIIRLQIPGESENAMFTQNGVFYYFISGIFSLFANSCLIIGINKLEKTEISAIFKNALTIP